MPIAYPITYHPKRWEMLFCDFSDGFKPPEMVKNRLVIVVVAEQKHNPGLCTVIPISATEPTPLKPYHHEMDSLSLPDNFRNKRMWAKCDMINTVSTSRLRKARLGRNRKTGKRIYYSGTAVFVDIQGVTRAMLHALKLERLTKHL